MGSSRAAHRRADLKEEGVRSRIRSNRFALVSVSLAIALLPAVANAQALVKVNDYVNFRLGILLQGQADFQQVANSANNDSGGWQQNMMLRRARFILGGQVAKDVFFYRSEVRRVGKECRS